MYRKLYHLGGLIFPVILLVFSRRVAIYTCGLLFIIITTFDLFRLQWKELNLLVIRKLPIRLKKKEVKGMSGSPYFLGGCLLTLILFKPVSAIGGIICLSIGDMAAVTVGKTFGRIKIAGEKTLEGTSGFIFFTLLIMFALKHFGVIGFPAVGMIAASVISACVELIPWKIDDNLTIPLTAALVLNFFG